MDRGSVHGPPPQPNFLFGRLRRPFSLMTIPLTCIVFMKTHRIWATSFWPPGSRGVSLYTSWPPMTRAGTVVACHCKTQMSVPNVGYGMWNTQPTIHTRSTRHSHAAHTANRVAHHTPHLTDRDQHSTGAFASPLKVNVHVPVSNPPMHILPTRLYPESKYCR